MDELNDFFKKPHVPPIVLRGPQTSGFRVVKEDISNDFTRRRNWQNLSVTDKKTKEEKNMLDAEYATEIRRQDDLAHQEDVVPYKTVDMMESLSLTYDTLTSTEHLVSETNLTDVYSKYSFRRSFTDPMPINTIQTEVLTALEQNSVVIIEGPTGCGKTTQVPQWILDDSYEKRRMCNIAVTQPRRIAAISIAGRVAHERGWELGELVGYQVGLDKKISNDTRLHYMTTGILLQKFVAAKNMNAYTHVILDEIHERGQEMDFLLLVVKKLLRQNSRGIKVILMSATFDSEKFVNYFNVGSTPGLKGTRHIYLDAKSRFTNTFYYLDQLRRYRNLPEIKLEEPRVSPQSHELVVRLLATFDSIDKGEELHEGADLASPSVLVFLPGIHEIEELASCLEDPVYRKKILENECHTKWLVLPLHSTVTSTEQAKVFKRAAPGVRKIILATNIAESSITVPDIKYVIDFCLTKVLVADQETHFTSLQLQWASQTNCIQRAGRAGRVRPGRVYRLVSKEFFKEHFQKDSTPEMERCPLERLVLLAKMLDMGPPKQILALAITPPRLTNIRSTVLVLKEVGGLLKTLNGETSYEDGDITYLGRIMAKLPVDIRVAKLIVLGHIFGMLEPAIIMGGAMTVKNIFSTPFRERLNAYNSKLTWADGSLSDCIAFYNMYTVWQKTRRSSADEKWGRSMYAQVRALRELHDMTRELASRLSREHIEPIKESHGTYRNPTTLILKVLITGAFYPNYFMQPAGNECLERDAFRALNGLDPCTTVYLKDFPTGQPVELYAANIKRVIKQLIVDEPRVTFDDNSNKVYLSFTNANEMYGNVGRKCKMPGRVALPVYKAVKARQLNLDIIIPSLPTHRARELAASLGGRERQPPALGCTVPRLPDVGETAFHLFISHVIDPGHFWVQNEVAIEEFQRMQCLLEQTSLLAITEDLRAGAVCLAPYSDGDATTYHRAIVQQVMPANMVWVFYMDYGNYGRVSTSSLRELPVGECTELPPFALECVLSETGPSRVRGEGLWSQEALEFFYCHTQNKKLSGQVFSVAHGVVALRLHTGSLCINDELVSRGLARRTDESYQSRLNHAVRKSLQELSQVQLRALNQQQLQQAARPPPDLAAVQDAEFTSTIRLKGPYSPLERNLQNVMYGGQGKQVQIEWNSVNSVLLDTEPQEPYQRLVVAAQVGQNTEGSKLTLRHTTVMPNIPGLPALMAMLFAPTAELRRDEARSRYASVLCGLGAEPAPAAAEGEYAPARPMFPDHDLLVEIDAEITKEDLDHINYLRYLMSTMMHCADGDGQPSISEQDRQRLPAIARDRVQMLLTRSRKHREYVAVKHAWDWGLVGGVGAGAGAGAGATENDDVRVEEAVYPPLAALRLYPLDAQLVRRQRDHNVKLHDMADRNISSSNKVEVVCELCAAGPMDLASLRIHLFSRTHKDKEEELHAFPA